MATINYTEGTVANVVERDIENFARVITDSYCQTHSNAHNFPPAEYAKAYFHVFAETLKALEEQINLSREKENEELDNMFK